MTSDKNGKGAMKDKIGISIVTILSFGMMTMLYFSNVAKSDIDDLKKCHNTDVNKLNATIIENQKIMIANQREIVEQSKQVALLALEIKHIRERQDEDKVKTPADVFEILRKDKK